MNVVLEKVFSAGKQCANVGFTYGTLTLNILATTTGSLDKSMFSFLL